MRARVRLITRQISRELHAEFFNAGMRSLNYNIHERLCIGDEVASLAALSAIECIISIRRSFCRNGSVCVH